MPRILPKNLSGEVADALREMIRKNELASGQKLSEQKLCERLGVSRTPLREALQTLRAEGLVEMIPNKGAYVTTVSLEEVRHMFEVMSVLEGTCAKMATERMTDKELLELEALHSELEERFAANDPHGYVRLNNVYHTFLQEKAGNPVLNNLVNGLRGVVLLHRYRQIHRAGRLESSMSEHRELLEAIKARDSKKAEQLMRQHLLNQGNALAAHYKEENSAEPS